MHHVQLETFDLFSILHSELNEKYTYEIKGSHTKKKIIRIAHWDV